MRLASCGLSLVLAVVAVLLTSALAGAVPVPIAGGGATAHASPVLPPALSASTRTSSGSLPVECPDASSGAAAWYASDLPVAVRAGLQSACPFVPDQASLSFLSNATGSADRFEFGVDLPQGTASPASALASFGLGLWVSGVPCSFDGAAFLDVELQPPYHYAGANGSANWTVHAPVDDLVPAGSCDPQCQNGTAFYSIAGTPYCEDDLVVSGVGGPTARGWGSFAPGDHLNVTFLGAFGGSSPLTVYLNDTTHPSSDLVWSYDAGVTADHVALTPLVDAAGWGPAAWGDTGEVAAIVQNCPTLSADGAATCNSYDGPAWNAVSAPSIVSAAYWNGTTLTYADGFGWTATASSTGGCVRACSDFTTFGGTGDYPYWSMEAFGGASAWEYGRSGPTTFTTWDDASQFAASGALSYAPAPTLAPIAATQIGNSVYLDSVAADPNDVQAVTFGAYWCFTGATPSVATTSGTLTVSLVDSARDGNWTGSFSTGTYSGTFNAWARAESFSGAWSAPVYVASSVTGVTACTLPSPAAPTFTSSNVTAAGGGFALNWSESSGAILGYTVYVNATAGGTHDVVPLGNVSQALLALGLPTFTNYSIELVAENAAHQETGTLVTGVTPLAVLTATLAGPTSDLWVGSAAPSFTATVSGGSAPYTYSFAFGDGASSTTVSSNLSAGASHNYGGYFGTAVATVTVTDAVGESVTSGPALVTVRATPLAVPQSIAAGAMNVNVSWLLPLSPAGSVTGYTVFSTTDAAALGGMNAALFGGPDAGPVTVTNTTNPWDTFAVPAGATVWAEVVAWDGYGAGTLPSNGTPLVAHTANLTAGPIQSTPSDGAAPFSDALSDFVLNGTNDAFLQSSYASGFNASGPTTLTPGAGGTWVNATLVLGSPGVHVVILHIADEFADFALQLTDVYVAPGAPLSLSLSPPGPAGWTGWSGTALTFRAQAIGGPGPFTFDWSFGDGGVGTGANATYAYASPGNYTITVTATDATTGGVGVHSQTMTVFAPPSVAIQSRPGPNGSLSWSFTAITAGGSGPPSLSWSFGDGSIANGEHATHDYGAPGTYTVNVSSVDPTGKSATATLALTVGASTSGSSSGGTYLGLSAGTWGGVAFGLIGLAVVLLIVLLLVAGRRGGRRGAAIERWRSNDERPRSNPSDRR